MKEVIKCVYFVVVGQYDQCVKETASNARFGHEFLYILAGGNLQQPAAVIRLAREQLLWGIVKWLRQWTVKVW